jgi:hypothetical protein
VVVRLGLDTGLELGDVGLEVRASALGLLDHAGKSIHLRAQRRDLALDPGEGVVDDRSPLGGILRRPEPVPVPRSGFVVLEELADLGEAEPGVVAKALDEPEPLEIILVVEAVIPF